MSESPILGLDGKPLQRPDLELEYAAPSMTGVRQAWMIDSVASGLTPQRLAGVLAEANAGNDYELLTLAEEIEERSDYGGLLGVRKRAVLALPMRVEAAGEDEASKEHAAAVLALIQSPAYRHLRTDLLDAIGKGRSVVEIIWNTRLVPWFPLEYKHRDARYFKYHPEDPYELRMIDMADLHCGLPLRPYTFIVHRPRIKTGIPCRDGLARMVVVYHMCMSFGLKDWMAFVELFGMPIRIGKYGAGAKEDAIAILRRAVANIGSDAAALIPDSMRIEFTERSNSNGADIFKQLLEWMIERITFIVLGQTASTQGTPGKLGGDFAQMQVASDIRDADASELDATINETLVRYYIDLNFGVQKAYPRIVSAAEELEDIDSLVKAVTALVPFGLRVKQSQMRDKLRLETPEDGDELLQIPAGTDLIADPGKMVIAPNHVQSCPHCSTALNRQAVTSTPDAVDVLVDEALSDWERVMTTMINPVQALADDCQDADEFRQRLPELLKTMDATALIEHLATASYKARGVGNAAG